MHRSVFIILWLLASIRAVATDFSPENPSSAPASVAHVSALKEVIEPLSMASKDLEELSSDLRDAQGDEIRQRIQTRIDAERERVRQLRQNFRDILGGAEAAEYDGSGGGESTIQEQISELIQPALSELRQATSNPRELEVLRKALTTWEERRRKAGIIISRIQDLANQNKDKVLAAEFDSARKFWEGRQAEASGQIGVIGAQIDERERRQKPFFEALSQVFNRFFRSRGLNLLMAVTVAICGFVITRKIYCSVRILSPAHRGGRRNLTSRISDILAVFLAVFVAIVGVLVVFYMRGDWLLLTLVVVLLLGVAWAGKHSLPPYLDQIRMMLNLGSVREGERVVYNGLPWRVASIGFFTSLINPNLQGGELHIPIRDLMEMTSRDPDQKEPWFPTECDDWVILADQTYGKVITQSPEQVVVLSLGGSLKTYATTDFLAQIPENISHGFRVACVFGIDYQHQAESTTSIPKILDLALTTALICKYGREAVRSIKVDLSTASASSLDYQIQVDFDGSMASRYQLLNRVIQTICVDTCNANGWVIPFTQITLHQGNSKFFADKSKA